MANVDKSIMSVLRKPKAAQPIIRLGVTRAGTVGVEFEHQGVKGWGRDTEAARMSWQQNRAMAKRHDVGKSDAWEVPMDHFSPALPQRRPNYGTGNTVGKRMTGAVTGVAKPKKVQPTRTAPRKAAGMLPIGTPPIAPSLVGKAAPHPLASISGGGFSRRDAILAGALGGGIGGGTGGYIGLKRDQKKRARTVDKRDRRYSPEHNRQRRLGIATAATAAGGLALGGRGVQNARRVTRVAREAADREGHRLAFLTDKDTKINRRVRNESGAIVNDKITTVSADERAAVRNLGRMHRHMFVMPSRRHGGQMAGGAGLLAASGAMGSYARSRANREYR